jgi:hypothetical protein
MGLFHYKWVLYVSSWFRYIACMAHPLIHLVNKRLYNERIVTCMNVTIDGVWIGDWNYRTLIHRTRNYK